MANVGLNVHESLASIGLPGNITYQDIDKLSHGPFSELLQFIGGHVVGRLQARVARNQIQSKHIGAVERTPDDKAVSRLASTRKHCEVYATELRERLQDMENARKHQLKAEQRVKFELEKLEQSEKKRQERIRIIAKDLKL
ncbi:hypothetical protein VNI00_009660 [Paramarasmius palmivorus]|uniref:Uncharacterized protein n=1 Tax=Paramarasmius palmivorus TaxID=297713 RepID=A0AAW0CP41_9AGAR